MNWSYLSGVFHRQKRSQAINTIASDYHYVREDARIQDLADELSEDESILAIGVVNENEKVSRILVRKEFFAMLGRPFGWDVLQRRSVKEVLQPPKTFISGMDFLSVSEDIDKDMKKPGITYYVLTNDEEHFRGIFSTQDMLVCLSEMTQTDISMARRLQSRIVKDRELVVGKNCELISSTQTAKGVGGDYYTIQKYSETSWIITLCDVSGKGVSASIITSVIWAMMSIYDFSRGLSSFIKEEKTGEVLLCDIGHSHIFLARGSKFKRITSNQNNLPIGVSPDIVPKISLYKPKEGDILYLITDGIIEQTNPGGKLYSVEQVASIIRNNRESQVEYLCDALLDDFLTFKGNSSFFQNRDFYSILSYACRIRSTPRYSESPFTHPLR